MYQVGEYNTRKEKDTWSSSSALAEPAPSERRLLAGSRALAKDRRLTVAGSRPSAKDLRLPPSDRRLP